MNIAEQVACDKKIVKILLEHTEFSFKKIAKLVNVPVELVKYVHYDINVEKRGKLKK